MMKQMKGISKVSIENSLKAMVKMKSFDFAPNSKSK